MTPNERAKAALRYQNRKNRAQGAFFEQMINGACDFYRSRQIADIEKTPEPMQPTKEIGSAFKIANFINASVFILLSMIAPLSKKLFVLSVICGAKIYRST